MNLTKELRENTITMFNYLIEEAKKNKASDIHIKPSCSPYVRVTGQLKKFVKNIISQEMIYAFLKIYTPINLEEFLANNLSYDFGIEIKGVRLRGTAFKDMKGVSIVLRLLVIVAEDFSKLGVPEKMKELVNERSGIIIITGPTGSGKTTTLTCLLDYINQVKSCHIITIEDPIEFVHTNKKSVITQRELGRDTPSFDRAIIDALREDPDVIMVGEMRDKESIEAALRAAETGHLVLATLHTRGAVNTVTRITDVFPAEQQDQVRTQFAMAVIGVLSQQLIPGIEPNTRHLATELMIGTRSIKSCISQGKANLITSTIQTAKFDGMYTMDYSIDELINKGLVDKKVAETYRLKI